jgi:N-acetylneuraminic acid mutarotase
MVLVVFVVAIVLSGTGSNAKASFASGAPVNLGVTLAAVSLAQGDVWTQKADMPTARLGLTTAVVNGKIYAIGGYARANSPAMKTVEEYDPATDTWTTKADMPTARMWLSASVVDGKIYVIGGWVNFWEPGISTVEEYDPSTDTWTQKADMPTARFGLATSVVDGMIYAIGGGTTPSKQLRTVEAYDPLTDTWTTKAYMPSPARMFHSTSVVDGKIYVIGGGGSSPNVVFSSVEEYDPATDTWTTITNMPEPRFALSSITVNGKIYVIGGRYGDQRFSTVEEYDPVTDIWASKASMPRPNGAVSASELNGKIYVIGGTEGATSTGSHPGVRTVYEYDTGLTVSSPDFNGDGIVDGADMRLMVDHWHTDYPLCDIAPTPFGDGIVDVQDLVLLSEHFFEHVSDPTLIAHWALDETEGLAGDSVGSNYGYVLGGAIWEPDGGQVGGAIRLDGVDGCIMANPVLNPEEGPFSVFAWVQGGAPGQVIVSGTAGANWLMLDAEGKLMTEIKSADPSGPPLLSQTVVTDANWHRVGLVWDGLYRTLCVDDAMVAEDIQDALEGSFNGLYIGCGKNMQPGTYFSGLIDDVRIYNRAVKP